MSARGRDKVVYVLLPPMSDKRVTVAGNQFIIEIGHVTHQHTIGYLLTGLQTNIQTITQ